MHGFATLVAPALTRVPALRLRHVIAQISRATTMADAVGAGNHRPSATIIAISEGGYADPSRCVGDSLLFIALGLGEYTDPP